MKSVQGLSARTSLVCLTVAFLGIAQQSRADLINNGSFENPAVPVDSFLLTTPSGWTWTAGDQATAIVINAGPAGFQFENAFYIPAESGQQFLGLGQIDDGVLSQVVTVLQNGDYTLTWFDSIGLENPQGTNSPYAVSFENDQTSAIVSGTFNAATLGGTSWDEESLSLPGLSAGQYTLSFTPEAPAHGFETLIDDVSLPALTTGTPEPSTFTLIACSLGLLAVRCSRRLVGR